MKIPPWLVAPLISGLYRMWCATLTIKVFGREAIDALVVVQKPMMFALWHDELFPIMHVGRVLKTVAVVSQSHDGEYLARLLHSLGIATVRGSSSRGGLKALLSAARMMRDQEYNGCITVDGPKGPRHVVKEGAIFLAFRTPAHIVPTRIFMKKTKVFRSWDKFQLPLPFSTVHIVFEKPYLVESTELTEDGTKKECSILQGKLEGLEAHTATKEWE